MLKLCTNRLVVWFVKIHVSDWLLVILPSPHPGAPTRPFTPKVLQTREHALKSLIFCYITLDLQLSLSRNLGVRQLLCALLTYVIWLFHWNIIPITWIPLIISSNWKHYLVMPIFKAVVFLVNKPGKKFICSKCPPMELPLDSIWFNECNLVIICKIFRWCLIT